MGSTAVTRVFCSNGHELDEDPSQPAEARVGCRECGDLSRLVDVRLEETVQMRTSLGLEARHDGERRPFHEQFTGSAQQSNGTWVEKHSVIDRDLDRRSEQVETEDGTVIYHQDHPLSEHRGHGSDKPELRQARESERAAKRELRAERKAERDARYRAGLDPKAGK